MTVKMRLRMKNRSHRYNINRPRPKMDTMYEHVFILNACKCIAN